MPDEDCAGLVAVELLAQGLDRVTGPRRLHDHDEYLDTVDGDPLWGPADRVADGGADPTDKNLGVHRCHTVDCAGLHADEEVAIAASVVGSGGGLAVGQPQHGLSDVPLPGRRGQVQAGLPLDPPVLIVAVGVTDGAHEGGELARTQQRLRGVDLENHAIKDRPALGNVVHATTEGYSEDPLTADDQVVTCSDMP